MTFPDFEKLTPQEQLDVLENADPMECPFWMERLKTALDNNAPQVLVVLSIKQTSAFRKIYESIIKIKK